MRQEYAHFYGKPLSNAEVERGFELANQRVTAKDYTNAVGMLEQVSKVAAVPVVFNNLGVLYAELNDKSRAINSFREALARDLDYRPVRLNLDRMKDVMALGADPVSREVEPNNSTTLANIIAPGKPVEGEIEAAVNDVDFFRVTTPPAPRDRITIEITNRSTTLAPVLKIFDEEGRITDWGKIRTGAGREPAANHRSAAERDPVPGRSRATAAAPAPTRCWCARRSPSTATSPMTTSSMRRGSRWARRSTAGIMDANDTDYFSFVSPRTGSVSITITNRSKTLIPALSTFYPDMRSSGFGPDVRTPGLNLRHTMDVQENQIYFLQVWSQSDTAGDYSLIIE